MQNHRYGNKVPKRNLLSKAVVTLDGSIDKGQG
jgi:hypothetical protein